MMRCAECHRSLIKPAYTAPESMGGWVLGRVCAEKAGKARPKKRRKCQIQQATAHAGQLDMFVILERAYLVELAAAPKPDEDDPLAAVPIIHRIVSAAGAPSIALMGPVSVFDMWRSPVTLAKRKPEAVQHITRVERTESGVRCIRILPQETPEWQIKEAARRAWLAREGQADCAGPAVCGAAVEGEADVADGAPAVGVGSMRMIRIQSNLLILLQNNNNVSFLQQKRYSRRFLRRTGRWRVVRQFFKLPSLLFIGNE